MNKVLLSRLLKRDYAFVTLYSLISLIIGVFFLFRQFGLSPDSMGYIDIAENIAQGDGFVLHTSLYPSYSVVRPLSEWMPLYPFLISIFIKIGINSTLSARLVPVIFLMLIPYPMFYLTKSLFNRGIAHASTIYLIFLYALILVGSYAWTETAFIFFTLMSMLFLSKLVISPQDFVIRSKINTFISGLFIGFAYLTKGNGILLIPVAFFVIFFLFSPIRDKIKQKVELQMLLFIGFSLVSGIWWIRNYLVFGNPFYYGPSYLFHTPSLKSFFEISLYHIKGLFPLVLCLPYALKYLYNSDARKKFLLLISFPLIMTLFFTGWISYDYRLLSPTFPFLIVLGMSSLFDISQWIKERFEIIRTLSNKILIVALLILFILPQVVFDFSYYSYGTKNFLNPINEKSVLEKMGTYDSIDWINRNTNQSDVLLSDHAEGIYYYTKRNVVWTLSDSYTARLNHSSLMAAISRLNISYIVLFKESINVDDSGDFAYNLSKGQDVPLNLDIVYNRNDAIIYRYTK